MRRIVLQAGVLAWLAIAAMLAAALLPVAAQAPIEMRLTQIDQSKFPVITAYISVTDANGKPVPGLSAADFRVTEDGRDVQAQLAGDSGPVHVVLVFDRSGSMNDQGKITGAQNAARTFVSQLRDQDQVALVAFNDQVQVMQDFTSDKTTLRDQINRLRPEGGTALYDALNQAVSIAAQTSGRKAIITLTDGQNNRGDRTPDQAIQAANAVNVPVYTIGLGTGSDIDENVLRQIATQTGAHYYNAPDANQLQALYDLLNQQIRGAYPLVYTSPRNYQDGTRRTVQVALQPSAPGLNLSAPLVSDGTYLVGGIMGATPPAQPGIERVNLPVFAGLLLLLLGLLALPPLLIGYSKRNGRVTRLPQASSSPSTKPVPMPVAKPSPVPPAPMPVAVPEQPKPAPMPTVRPSQSNGHSAGVSLAEAPVLVKAEPAVRAPAPARLSLALPLNKTLITIGSAPENDMIIPVRSVAPYHAQLRKENDRYIVNALAQDAPVYVSYSGDPSQERQVEHNAVKPGSTIRVGTVTLSVGEDTLVRHIPFIAEHMTIGSGAEADIQLKSPDLAPLQAAIEWVGDRYILVDLAESVQPRMMLTYGGEQSQKRAVHGRNALRSGSVIHIGPIRLTLSVFEGDRG